MAKCLCKLLFTFLFFLLAGGAAHAQSVTGIWRGYFITDNGEQYKFEIQVKQSASVLSGVSYSYLDTRFYGKASLTGHFNKSTDMALVQEIRTIEVRMSGGSVACIMKCNLAYSRSGAEEFLEGSFISAYEKADTLLGIPRGGNCGGGKLFLRKVPTSDFYVEPFLRTDPKTEKPTTPITKKPAPAATAPRKPAAKAPAPAPKKVPPAVQKNPGKTPAADTVKRTSPTPPTQTKPAEKPKISVPAVTRSRTNELIQTLSVKNRDIEVKLYDNGEIDDDTISVYLDNKLVLASKRLSAAPIMLKLTMENAGEEHVLVMVAENMGRIPPNTSLMIVNDGDKRYEVRVTSTEQKNAMIRFRYDPAE